MRVCCGALFEQLQYHRLSPALHRARFRISKAAQCRVVIRRGQRDTISDGVYGADQKIVSRPLLLRLVTINYARLIGEDKARGSIEPGKLADFVVMTDDFQPRSWKRSGT